MIKKLRYIIIFIVIVFLLVSSLSYMCYARYYENINGTISASVAKPIIVLETDNRRLDNVNINTEIEDIYFKIKNFNNDAKSDIPFNYKIFIECSNNETVSCKLYQIEGSMENEIVLNNDYTTNYILLNNKENVEHQYKLKVHVNKVNKDDIDIRIKLIASQMGGTYE